MTHTESDLDAAIEIEAEPDDSTGQIAEDLSSPMTIGVDAYISEEYARAVSYTHLTLPTNREV